MVSLSFNLNKNEERVRQGDSHIVTFKEETESQLAKDTDLAFDSSVIFDGGTHSRCLACLSRECCGASAGAGDLMLLQTVIGLDQKPWAPKS